MPSDKSDESSVVACGTNVMNGVTHTNSVTTGKPCLVSCYTSHDIIS